jgi:hypothetical protein
MFYFFSATQAPIILILYRQNKNTWRMCKYNIETDELIKGQWMHGDIDVKRCSLSPCGEYFYYTYNSYDHDREKSVTHIIVSHVPYFTALLYSNDAIGRYSYPCTFDSETGLPIIYKNEYTFELQRRWGKITSLDNVIHINERPRVDMGNVENFKHVQGLRVEGNKIIHENTGQVIYDTTDEVYEYIPYPDV